MILPSTMVRIECGIGQYKEWGESVMRLSVCHRLTSRWVRSWIIFRLAIIVQGISARAALGQASSADAKADDRGFNFFGRMAWDAKRDADKESQGSKL